MKDHYHFDGKSLSIKDPNLGLDIEKQYDIPMLPDLLEEKKGLALIKDVSGNIIEACHESEGKLHGQCRRFEADGSLNHESYYFHGVLVGPSRYFSSFEAPLSETWYVDGVKQGKARKYHLNNSLYSLQRYLDGEYHGKQEFYYDNGDVKSTLNYDRGKLDGEVKLYYPYKKIKRELKYDQGERIDWEIEYDESGIKRHEILHPTQEVVRSWYPEGILAEERMRIKEIKLEKESGEIEHIYLTRKWRNDGFLYYDEIYNAEEKILCKRHYNPNKDGIGVQENFKWNGNLFVKS